MLARFVLESPCGVLVLKTEHPYPTELVLVIVVHALKVLSLRLGTEHDVTEMVRNVVNRHDTVDVLLALSDDPVTKVRLAVVHEDAHRGVSVSRAATHLVRDAVLQHVQRVLREVRARAPGTGWNLTSHDILHVSVFFKYYTHIVEISQVDAARKSVVAVSIR